MLTFLQDVRFAFRQFASHPGFTLLLMTAAGTAIQGFRHMMRIPLGYDPHHVMSVGIPIHDNTYTTISERSNYYEQLRGAIALPDVVATGISTNARPLPTMAGSSHLGCWASPPRRNKRRGSTLSIRATSPLCTCRSGKDEGGTTRSLCTVLHWYSSMSLLPNASAWHWVRRRRMCYGMCWLRLGGASVLDYC
jgi:hypothetical protein